MLRTSDNRQPDGPGPRGRRPLGPIVNEVDDGDRPGQFRRASLWPNPIFRGLAPAIEMGPLERS